MKGFSKYKVLLTGFLLCLLSFPGVKGQPVPGKDENIPFLCTFGKNGDTSWGDDDFSQTFFFAIPNDFKGQFYIRVFDPECSGENDEMKGVWDTKMLYSVYGGRGVDPENPNNLDSRGLQPTGNYKSGTLLASKTFSNEKQYDNKYYTFGPFIAAMGDYNEKWKSYMFKIICDGVSGDDGNLYRYFLSREQENDVPIEAANAFTYEYTFRMWNNVNSVSHIYPFIDTGIVYVQQTNFDWDSDGSILVVSRIRQGVSVKISTQNDKVVEKIGIESGEIGYSLDFQFHKFPYLIKNNNVVISLENQRGDLLKFYSAPIGGVPKYEPKPTVKKMPPKK
jgi:hypothetical protein